MRIDFGEKKLQLVVKVVLRVVVLSHSRRIFVKAFLNPRGDDWREVSLSRRRRSPQPSQLKVSYCLLFGRISFAATG